jgi:hypothetical protein
LWITTTVILNFRGSLLSDFHLIFKDWGTIIQMPFFSSSISILVTSSVWAARLSSSLLFTLTLDSICSEVAGPNAWSVSFSDQRRRHSHQHSCPLSPLTPQWCLPADQQALWLFLSTQVHPQVNT